VFTMFLSKELVHLNSEEKLSARASIALSIGYLSELSMDFQLFCLTTERECSSKTS
jgi:hypothetical protein